MSKYIEAINGTVLYDRSYVLNRSLVVDCQLHTDKQIDTGHYGGGLVKVLIPPWHTIPSAHLLEQSYL